MANNEEPMDVDIHCEFDDKENSVHHSNVYQLMPCTEKGYEELDVSELNMKLRYSLSPVSSSMSKSYTANSVDLKSLASQNEITNPNLSRSFNSTTNRSQGSNKSFKVMPLQSITTDNLDDNTRHSSIPTVVNPTVMSVQGNATVTIIENNEGIDELFLATSSSSSPTPSSTAITPTKDIQKNNSGSPIMRGIKSVLNMFRSSQSPIPPIEDNLIKEDLSPNLPCDISPQDTLTALASTPIAVSKCKDVSKCNSPHKESIVFNDDLEKELLWKDETTILFSEEKIPIHKLFLQQPNIVGKIKCENSKEMTKECLNSSLEYMDVSYDNTVTDLQPDTNIADSEGEFLDCMTTFTEEQKQTDNNKIECNENKNDQYTDEKKLYVENVESGSGVGEMYNENNKESNFIHISAEIKSQQHSLIFTEATIDSSENVNNTEANNFSEQQSEIESQRHVVLQANKELKTNNIIGDNELQNFENNNCDYIPNTLSISKCEVQENMPEDATNICNTSLLNMLKACDDNSIDDILSNIDQLLIDQNETIKSHTEQMSNNKDLLEIECNDHLTETNINPQESICNRNLNTHSIHADMCMSNDTVKSDQEIKKLTSSDDKDLNATIILPDKYISKDAKKTDNYISCNIASKTMSNDISVSEVNVSNNVENIEIGELSHTAQLPQENNHSVQSMSEEVQSDTPENTCKLTDHSTEILSLNNTESKTAITNSFIEISEILPKIDLSLISTKIDINDSVMLQGQFDHSPHSITSVEKVTVNSINCDTENKDGKINYMIQEKPLPDLLNNSIDVLEIHLKCDIDSKIINITNECCQEGSMQEQILKKNEMENNVNKDMLLSENNSHQISNSQIETMQNTSQHSERVVHCSSSKSQKSSSPKIMSRECNVNFEEIVDPFATKSKIRLSPPLDFPHKNIDDAKKSKSITNDSKFQLEIKNTGTDPGKKNDVNLKAEHFTFDNDVNTEVLNELNSTDSSFKTSLEDFVVDTEHSDNRHMEIIDTNITASSNVILIDNVCTDKENTVDNMQYSTVNIVSEEQNSTDIDNNLSSIESVTNSIHVRTTSSSEQSAYFSVATSSCESGTNKSVFNIPEINDNNFTPFTTKSQMCHSLKGKEENFDTNVKAIDGIGCSEKITINEHEECINVSNISYSSKAPDDKDITVIEINTEDEDTLEGPFLGVEEIETDNKMPALNCDDNNLIPISDLPFQDIYQNIEGEELFIDAEAFEFLLNQNQSNVVSNNGKESLFLKFDPLFAKRISIDGGKAFLQNDKMGQFTPTNKTVAQKINTSFEKPGPSTLNLTYDNKANSTLDVSTSVLSTTVNRPMMIVPLGDNTLEMFSDDINNAISKPMMVVSPAVNPIVALKNKPFTPVNSNRRSITFTSPAIAVIDQLLSISGNNSLLNDDANAIQTSRDQNEANIALRELRELLSEKELHSYTLRAESDELKDRLSLLESQMHKLDSERESRLKKINDLTETLTVQTKINKNMTAVLEEYERTNASLITETEEDKTRHNAERINLMKERDEQNSHLANMEASFNDVHSKYEKCKQTILSMKANEDKYNKSINEFEENVSKMQSNYELLKQHATSKLNHANQELEKINRLHHAEVVKLTAMIKRKELDITSLEYTLAQKTKANDELAAICDDLLKKVG